jgi:hypothetical protein
MFSERGSQGLSIGTNVASYLANFFSVFTSIVYAGKEEEKFPFLSSHFSPK